MGEDRRPNVGGRSTENSKEPQGEQWSEKQLELEAKRLRSRKGVDGHEKGVGKKDPRQA